MKNRILFLSLAIMAGSLSADAQTPKMAYNIDGLNLRHELNPALTSDSSYWSVPLLGSTSATWHSTLKLGDLIYDHNGELTTFMNNKVISRSDFMDKVGSRFLNNTDVRLTLLSAGYKYKSGAYRTASITWRNSFDMTVPRSMFNFLKELRNTQYEASGTALRASSWIEFAAGESRQINEKLKVGAKAKLLLGMYDADVDFESLNVDLSNNEKWMATAKVNATVTGLDYKVTQKKYDSRKGTYNAITGASVSGISPHGLGLAFDAGADYRMNDTWSFSAAITDLGFISWFGSKDATNKEGTFEFSGFKNVNLKDGSENSFQSQADRLKDSLTEIAHLEEDGTSSHTDMLACNMLAAAEYRYDDMWKGGLVLSSRIMGKYSSYEARMNVCCAARPDLDIVVSPAYSTYGFGLGAMVSYHHKDGIQAYIGLENPFTAITHQLLPTAHVASINIGVTLPMAILGIPRKP